MTTRTQRPSVHRPKLASLLLATLLSLVCLPAAVRAGPAPPDGRCYLIDTDMEIDDVRAVALLA
ncbi:hypothetical protein, partial [Paracraurococcus lichenis]